MMATVQMLNLQAGYFVEYIVAGYFIYEVKLLKRMNFTLSYHILFLLIKTLLVEGLSSMLHVVEKLWLERYRMMKG